MGRCDAQLYPQANGPDDPHPAGDPHPDVRRHPVRAGRTGRAGLGRGAHGCRGRLQGARRRRCQADRGAQEALRIRQARPGALPGDAAKFRPLRPWTQLRARPPGVGPDQGKTAGVDEPGPVDLRHFLPHLGAAGHRQGGARRFALRHDQHGLRADRLCHPGIRPGRVPDRPVCRGHVLGRLSAARTDLGQLVGARVAGARSRLPVAPDAAAELPGDRQLCRDDDAHQEHVHRGDPPPVCPGGAGQRPVAVTRALEARVSKRLDSHRDGISCRLRQCLLLGRLADREPVFAGRPGTAVVRVGHPSRLSGGAGVAVPVHAGGSGGQADVGPHLRDRRPAAAVRRRREESAP